MRKNLFAVFDHDIAYAKSFVHYLLKYKKINKEVILFTSLEQLMKYMEESYIEVLLISERAVQLLPENNVKQIIILSEDQKQEEGELLYIYKYQSVEMIIERLDKMLKDILESSIREDRMETVTNTKVFGIYSPSGGALCVTVGLALAKAISEEKRILLLDCETFSGFPIERNYTDYYSMSDLIYYAKNKKEEIWKLVKEKLYCMENIDVLIPVQHYKDLLEVTQEDITFFMKQISTDSMYDLIFICIDFYTDFTKRLLDHCSKVFIPTSDQVYMKNKETAFFQMLKLDEEENLDKYIAVYIPQPYVISPDIQVYSQGKEILNALSVIKSA
ncbi:MinD family ATPase from ParA/SOJ subfamily [Lachnospiraceae bacterium KM106-2]|nr:MinD family ATPase from ParA/SOJ subfamily [Lachnospiraceae bacterium KM106-2]